MTDGTETPRVSFQRFVIEVGDGEGTERFTELARLGLTVYVCTGRDDEAPTHVEIRALRSEEAAERGLEKRIATLRKNGYLADGVVERPLPLRETAGERDRAREALYAKARALFDAALPAFLLGWRAEGFDPTLGFHAQCLKVKRLPNDVALRCLLLASSMFGVAYTRRTTEYDPEHGDVLPVPERLLAEFYVSPSHVLALAHEKLRGRSMRVDDIDAPGLVDEITLRLRTE